MTAVWEILVASVWARTGQLADLLGHLSAQISAAGAPVQVLVDRDNGDTPVGVKRTRLLEAARAPYVCFVDDDDQVADDYVPRIMDALAGRPDYIGFEVAYTIDGHLQKPVYHSLEFPVWGEDERGYYRGVSHINPIRRDAAMVGLPFLPGFGEDADWARRVQASGLVQWEVYLPGPPLYLYRWSAAGSLFQGGRRTIETEPLLAVPAHVEVLP